jgi:hypothetical protein
VVAFRRHEDEGVEARDLRSPGVRVWLRVFPLRRRHRLVEQGEVEVLDIDQLEFGILPLSGDLVTAALALLPTGGVLITASNHQKTDLPDYLKELRRGALQAGCDLRVIHSAGQPADFPYPVTFPEGRYLKYLVSIKT